MKKTMTLLLVLALLMSAAVSVYAATGNPADVALTLDPALTSASCDTATSYDREESKDLPQESQDIFTQAEDLLPGVVPKDMKVMYFSYIRICENCQDMSASFHVEGNGSLMAMQFVDGQWVELDHEVEDEDTVTVTGIVEGPIVLMVKKVVTESVEGSGPAEQTPSTGSPAASEEDLKPEVSFSSCREFTIYTTVELESLQEVNQEAFAAAKEALPEAVPEGMLTRYFFYVDICEACGDSSVMFQLDDYDSVSVMQYVEDAWVELEFAVHENGNMVAQCIADGPVAVFVK